MKQIEMIIQLEPRGQMRPRRAMFGNGRLGMTKHEKQKLEESKLLAALYEHKPEKPWTGAISLAVSCWFTPPESASWKWKQRALTGQIPYTKKPDLDNILKHLKDVMQGVFFVDDKQIVKITAEKGYSDFAHYDIVMSLLEE